MARRSTFVWDGAGYDNLDVPDGSNQPKLQFTAFVPTGDFFNTMRKNQASLDLVAEVWGGGGGQRPGAVHHGDATAELLGAATPAAGVPAAGLA